MSPVLVVALFSLCTVALAGNHYVEPEYLDMLRASGRDEEFARLLGIDVSLVRSQEGRSEEDLKFTTVSEFGDILLTPEQEEQARQGINFSKYGGSKWPNNQIPYVISTSDFTTAQRAQIENAIAALNERTKNLKIVRRGRQRDYVNVISGDGCYSYLGKTGRAQALSLQRNGCLSTGTIQHEFIHAAGFTHEHNRPDRDTYVKVLFENIPPEWHSQYEKVNRDDFGIQGPYDYYSVMHYPYNAPGTNKPAFEIYDKTINPVLLGESEVATDTDIQKIDTLYS